MSSAARIDVHQHVLPEFYRDVLSRRGMDAWAPHAWSVSGALEAMDRYDVDTGVLSLSAPGCHFGNDTEARGLAREVNEAQAELVRNFPGRFGMFATVPLPDVDGALETIAYAYDELGADGVVLLANSGGTYLGDAAYEPVMAELDRRAAVVFVHPTGLPGGPARGIHPALVDFLLDTTRAAVNMAVQGVLRRYPALRVVLAHGGGFLPYAAHRIATITNPGTVAGLEETTPAAVLDDLSGFYFDTALTSSPTALPSLLAFARPGHVMFGSDWPYAPTETVDYFTSWLDAYGGLDLDTRRAIDRGSAEVLLPRLAAQPALQG